MLQMAQLQFFPRAQIVPKNKGRPRFEPASLPGTTIHTAQGTSTASRVAKDTAVLNALQKGGEVGSRVRKKKGNAEKEKVN